jgi:hypothetical protein
VDHRDENEVIVIAAADDVEKIALGIGGRRVAEIACSHADDDHVDQASTPSGWFRASVLPPGRGATVGDDRRGRTAPGRVNHARVLMTHSLVSCRRRREFYSPRYMP